MDAKALQEDLENISFALSLAKPEIGKEVGRQSRRKAKEKGPKEKLCTKEMDSLEGPQEEADVQRRALRRGKNFAVGKPTVHSLSRVIPTDFKKWHSQLPCSALTIKKG